MELSGIYDSGSNVSLIYSKFLKLNKNESNSKKANLITINGVKKTDGLTTLKIKIFDIEKKTDIYIIEEKHFKYDFLIGLDMIKEFRLSQDEDLRISQKTFKQKKIK